MDLSKTSEDAAFRHLLDGKACESDVVIARHDGAAVTGAWCCGADGDRRGGAEECGGGGGGGGGGPAATGSARRSC